MEAELTAGISIKTTEERSYRKNLATSGMLYLGYQEHEIRVVNLSLTGILVELADQQPVADVREIFNALQISPIVDIYLPEMRIMGEAEVVRAETIDDDLRIAIEFRNLSYDADALLYSRRAYRKAMTAPGRVVFADSEHTFNTENVSVDGLMIRMLGRVEVAVGALAKFEFKHLELQGEGKVVWVEFDEDSTLMGLQYQHMERLHIQGVPDFHHPD